MEGYEFWFWIQKYNFLLHPLKSVDRYTYDGFDIYSSRLFLPYAIRKHHCCTFVLFPFCLCIVLSFDLRLLITPLASSNFLSFYHFYHKHPQKWIFCKSVFMYFIFNIAVFRCKPNPCYNGGICADLGNSYKCSCKKPYSGKRCQG